MPKRKFPEKARAYAWTAYMLTHAPQEIKRFLKYGSPSDELIRLADRRIFVNVDKNDVRTLRFPVSLHKSAGQKLLFKAAQDLIAYKQAIPVAAYDLFMEFKSSFKHRRADTTANVLMVAEALLSRCATEVKQEILFSFDSINAWVKAKYGKTLGYLTIRRALELLESKFVLTVREWGQKNNRHKATKIYVNFDSSWRTTDSVADADLWFLENAPAMKAVYDRESATRADVCVAQIHKYAEMKAEEIRQVVEQDLPPVRPVSRFFAVPSDRIHLEQQAAPAAVLDEKEIENDEDAYIDRLLGELVSAMSADDAGAGSPRTTIHDLIRISKGKCRLVGERGPAAPI